MTEVYNPQPLETIDISLPEELTPLIEEMAKNVHDVWARARMDEGWTYGAVRDDATKKHPCLVPYQDLPDSEKEYDRATSRETLKYPLEELIFQIIYNEKVAHVADI